MNSSCLKSVVYYGFQLESLDFKASFSPSTVSHSAVGPRIREQLGNGGKRERARSGLGQSRTEFKILKRFAMRKNLSPNSKVNF